MIDGSTIRHASTCMDIALEMFEDGEDAKALEYIRNCLLYTSPSPRDRG